MTLGFLALATIVSAPLPPATPARASASVSVQILSGAQVHLGPASTQYMVKATIRMEDGQRRPAYLIEFN